MPKNISPLTAANHKFKQGDYEQALLAYEEIAEVSPKWAGLVKANIALCKRRLGMNADDEVDSEGIRNQDNVRIINRPKVLLADFRYPRYDISAGELATLGIIKMFAELGFDVTFIPKVSTPLDKRYIRKLSGLGVNCVTGVTSSNFGDLLLEAAKDIDVAYIFRPDVAELAITRIRSVSKQAHVFYHAPDVYFRREIAQSQIESGSMAISGDGDVSIRKRVASEVRSAAISDHVVCVSKGDAEALTAVLANPEFNRTGIEPPGITVFPLLYLSKPKRLPAYADTKNLCFIGSSEHTPNRDAIRWFLENVWNGLLVRHPKLRFCIIGKTDQDEKAYYQGFNNVDVLGWVEDIQKELLKFRLSVAPLRYGAGIKGKVGLSVLSGIPCVASTVATEDMGFTQGKEIQHAESVDEYINAISLLLENRAKWEAMSRNGSRRAEQLYSEEATLIRFLGILNLNGVLKPDLYAEYINRRARSAEIISVPCPLANENVDVSIVIPGYNNEDLSKACITSVCYSLRPDERFTCEIIYADDASETGVIDSITSKFSGITVTKTERNTGFVANCNTGAKSARGRYLVLLNNDAVVLPGWLGALFAVMEDSEKCTVAGSKLLYPNAKIQEAGAGIWTDGRSLNFGRGPDGGGVDANAFEHNHIREVDYLSFASVMIRREFWDRCRGLNESYGFGYFDDSDFCMNVRAEGGIVLYVPDSEIIHNECSTFSKRMAKQVAKEKRENLIHFRTKWAKPLMEDHLPFERACWDPSYTEYICMANAARHRVVTQRPPEPAKRLLPREQRHILYFSPFPSHPASHGNQTTIQKFGQFLKSEGHVVHFVLMPSHLFDEDHARQMSEAWDTFDVLKLDRFPGCDGNLIGFDGWYVQGMGEQIAELCVKYQIDTVICSYVFQSRLLEYVPRHALKIVDTHDKFTDRYAILDSLGKSREFFSCSRREEGMYLSRADVVLARRDEEADFFSSISTAKAITVPHLEDKNYLEKGARPLRKVGLVASRNQINLEIVVNFVQALIAEKKEDWDFEVAIAGEVNTLFDRDDPRHVQVLQHPSVSLLGFVPDIKDFYQQVDLIVCPIMSGTGINVKTVQALAHGMPLLATEHASKGVATDYPHHQFADVTALCRYLLGKAFDAATLKAMAKQSCSIYDSFLDKGYAGFREALSLQQPGLREGVGRRLELRIPSLYSAKATLVNLASARKKNLGRADQLKLMAGSLKTFGPAHIDLRDGLPNLQSNGGVGYWFGFDKPIQIEDELAAVFNGIKTHIHPSEDRRLFTASVPPEHFDQAKEIVVTLDYLFANAIPDPDNEPIVLGKVVVVAG